MPMVTPDSKRQSRFEVVRVNPTDLASVVKKIEFMRMGADIPSSDRARYEPCSLLLCPSSKTAVRGHSLSISLTTDARSVGSGMEMFQ